MITLPWPPTVNTYWRNFRGRMVISKEGREYRQAVSNLIQGNWRYTKSVKVFITAYRPDNRKRDLDNLLKATLDSLTYAGIWEDDSQIVDLRIVWGNIIAGMLKVEIESVDDPRTVPVSKKSASDDSKG
jgi:crossover junction endodeoxyribonuclease RusA